MTGPQRRIVQAMERLKLRQIRLLVAVADHRSILHAARAMNISQPAATTLIKDLEADLQSALFNRTNRGVVPTPLGDSLIRNGRLILNQMGRAAQELTELRDGTGGRLAVGTLLAGSATLLPHAILRAQQGRPNLHVKVSVGTNEQLMPALRAGELDMVVGRLSSYRYRQEVVQEPLYSGTIVGVCRPGHPICARGAVTLDALRSYGWILPPPDTTLRRQVEQMFSDCRLPLPVSTIESVDFLTNRRLLADSDLIGILPDHISDPDIAAGILARIDWDVPIPHVAIGVSYLGEDTLTPAAAVFLDALRAEGAALQRAWVDRP
ncbi:MAG: LysR substrate-binding domain-containing protein [Pseudorhodobacter sp.]